MPVAVSESNKLDKNDAWKGLLHFGAQLEERGKAEKNDSLEFQGKMMQQYSHVLKLICEDDNHEDDVIMMATAMGFQSIVITMIQSIGQEGMLRENVEHFLDTLRRSFLETVDEIERGRVEKVKLGKKDMN